jgi:hypothetical protein
MWQDIKEYTKDWRTEEWAGACALLGAVILIILLLGFVLSEAGFFAALAVLSFLLLLVGGIIWSDG